MKERKIVRQFTLDTEIYDVELPQKVLSILQTEPLEITFAKKPEKTMAENFEIGCPEFLLYHESTSGNWTLKKVEALSVVQAEITKRGYNLKTTARMAVLQKFYDSQEFMIKYTNNILLIL